MNFLALEVLQFELTVPVNGSPSATLVIREAQRLELQLSMHFVRLRSIAQLQAIVPDVVEGGEKAVVTLGSGDVSGKEMFNGREGAVIVEVGDGVAVFRGTDSDTGSCISGGGSTVVRGAPSGGADSD